MRGLDMTLQNAYTDTTIVVVYWSNVNESRVAHIGGFGPGGWQ
jgi:hypothetical protein